MSPGRFPDLGDLRITACSAAPRSFSQLGHVLLRLWTPRHPPCTLCSLTTLFVFAVRIRTDVAVRADVELRLGALLLSVHRGRHFIPDSPRFQRARALHPIGRAVRQSTALCASHSFQMSTLPHCTRGWRRRDSNPRPPGCKPGALPAELRPRDRAASLHRTKVGPISN